MTLVEAIDWKRAERAARVEGLRLLHERACADLPGPPLWQGIITVEQCAGKLTIVDVQECSHGRPVHDRGHF